jgi:hypothetical protein
LCALKIFITITITSNKGNANLSIFVRNALLVQLVHAHAVKFMFIIPDKAYLSKGTYNSHDYYLDRGFQPFKEMRSDDVITFVFLSVYDANRTVVQHTHVNISTESANISKRRQNKLFLVTSGGFREGRSERSPP